jgi:hypothetical protein
MQIMTQVYTRLLAAAAKASVTAGNFSGPLVGTYLGLYTAISPNPSPQSARADLTEATFTGYARKALTWSTPADSQLGFSELLAGLLTWTPSDAVTPNTIIGVALFDAATAGNLLGMDVLSPVIPLPNQFTSLNYVPAFGLLFNANYDSGTPIP